MPNSVEVKIEGLDSLIERLTHRQETALRRGTPAILIKAADAMVSEQMRQAPVETGFLRSHFDTKFGEMSKGAVTIYAGPNKTLMHKYGGRRRNVTAFLIAYWIEFGHNVRNRKKTMTQFLTKRGKLRKKQYTIDQVVQGAVPSNPFITRAFKKAEGQVNKIIADGIANILAKF